MLDAAAAIVTWVYAALRAGASHGRVEAKCFYAKENSLERLSQPTGAGGLQLQSGDSFRTASAAKHKTTRQNSFLPDRFLVFRRIG